MRIYLLGYMGCGKSTFGPRLAEFLALPFYDLDITFEERYRISIHDFFTKYGEKHFREIEHILLKEITKKEDFVLATGGGTPCFFNNMDFMNTHGISVYMKLTPESLVNRLKQSPKKRPVLKGLENGDLYSQLAEHLKNREHFYLLSSLVIDALYPDPEEISKLITDKAFQLKSD